MYVRTVKSGKNTYLRVVEGYRDAETGKVKQRVVKNFGRLDQENDVKEAIIRWAHGVREEKEDAQFPIEFCSVKEFGNIWILQKIWEQLGFGSAIRSALKATKHNVTLTEALIRLMVFCQLCDPTSKLGVVRWLSEVDIPGISKQVSHQKLLRAMDAIEQNIEAVHKVVSSLIRPLIDQELTLALYDLTTVRVYGTSNEIGDLRKKGKSKDTNGVSRQIVFGAVQTSDGIPLMFQVHPGNTAEPNTLIGMVQQLTKLYPIRRIVAIADRGLLTTKNIESLANFNSINGQTLQFILAVPIRRHQKELQVIGEMEFNNKDGIQETTYLGHRLIVSFKSQYAHEQRTKRIQKIEQLTHEADEKILRLQTLKIRKPSHDQKALKEFRNKVKSKGLSRIIKASINQNGQFEYYTDVKAWSLAENFDGKLGLLTNVPEMTKADIVTHYNTRSDIESSFRTLKGKIKIAPVFHRLPYRIKTHGLICFLALLLNRIIRMRLRARGISDSPETALHLLRDLKQIEFEFNGEKKVKLTNKTPQQLTFISALEENITATDE